MACREVGILPGTWVTRGINFGTTEPHDSRFMIAEDESPDDRLGILDAFRRGLPDKPKAIIGNGWNTPSSKAELAPVVAAGTYFITECYARTDWGTPTGYTPEGLADNAHRLLGFPMNRIQHAWGMFGGAGDLDYDQWKPLYPGWSDYLVEYVFTNA